MMDARPSIRGGWYPGDAARLRRSLEDYLAAVEVGPAVGRVRGAVVPHAGHRYSGRVAAHAFARLRGLQPELVVVVSPYHYASEAALLTTAHEAYETPLGFTPVDEQAATRLDAELSRRWGLRLKSIANDPEHAVEVEVPFLQHVLPAFRLLPVMICDQRPSIAEALGRSLAGALRGVETLLVASSDLSHFYPQDIARAYDGELLRRLEAFSPEGVMEAESEGVGFACGRGAIAAVLWAAQGLGADSVEVLNYATSGDVTGDLASVVGYASAIIWERSAAQEAPSR